MRAAQSGGPLTRIGRGLRTLAGYVSDGAVLRMPARTLALAVSPYLVAFGPLVFAALTGLDEIWSMVAFISAFDATSLRASIRLPSLRQTPTARP